MCVFAKILSVFDETHVNKCVYYNNMGLLSLVVCVPYLTMKFFPRLRFSKNNFGRILFCLPLSLSIFGRRSQMAYLCFAIKPKGGAGWVIYISQSCQKTVFQICYNN